MKIKSALISVSDKTGLNKILKELKKYRVPLGYNCEEVSSFTKFPEILDGRVKTLHPKIHSGILYKRDKNSHKRTIKKLNFKSIDLIITNFYPFENSVNLKKNHQEIIENIDIGGPTLVRSAAKNYKDVVVISRIDQYEHLIKQINFYNGGTSLEFRSRM